MKRITIGGKEYTFTFSVAATLYNECVETLMNSFVTGGIIEETVKRDPKDAMSEFTSTIANIPQLTLTLFYAGLLEYHGMGRNGDGSVRGKEDALEIMTAYLYEHPEENDGAGKSIVDIRDEMMELIASDNFFDKIGLNKLFEEKKKRPRKQKEETGGN